MEKSRSPLSLLNHRLFLATLVLLLLSFLIPEPASAQRIKLGTLVPNGTSHHQALLKMGQDWKKATGGKINLTIYPDGVIGSEAAMVKRMRIGQIQASLLTVVGLTELEPAASGLSFFPFTFRDLDELTYVRERIQPMLADRMRKKGFVVLFWADSGWITFFSRKPVVKPDDLRPQKLFSWAGESHNADLYRRLGFKPVSLETAQIYPSLQNGMIDAVAMPPFYALVSRVYSFAPHMLEKNYAPMVGACVVTEKVWKQIPEAQREEVLRIAQETGEVITEAGRKESQEAIDSMKEKWGLKVHPVTPAAMEKWEEVSRTALEGIRGKIVPEEIFDRVMELLKEYRAKS